MKVPALTLAGTKQWWTRKLMERFAVAHLSLPMPVVSATFSRMAEAVTETRALIAAYIAYNPPFKEIGRRLIDSWDEGMKRLMV